MKILISNDDGVYAPGIIALAKEMATFAEILVVAPDRDMSATSKALTLRHPLRIKTIRPNWIAVEGTPTDSVHLALTGIMDEKPDLVVSGINNGSNLGDDVFYSGTVAAAMEGRYLGVPSIAISLAGEKRTHYDTAAKVAGTLVKKLLADPLPKDTFLNVNVPDLPFEQLGSMEVARLGKRHCAERMQKETDPRGHDIYWIGPAGREQDAGPGTDFHAVRNGHVSLTPITMDLTHYKLFEQISHWTESVELATAEVE